MNEEIKKDLTEMQGTLLHSADYVTVYMADGGNKKNEGLGKDCKGMPIIRITILSTPCFAGIDTGADYCLMSNSLANKVLPTWKDAVYPVPLTMSGVTGHELKLYGAVDLPVHIDTSKGTKHVKTQFIIWDNKAAPLLLGNQWLREINGSFDPNIGLRLPDGGIVHAYCRKKCLKCVQKWEEQRKINPQSDLFRARNASDAYLTQTGDLCGASRKGPHPKRRKKRVKQGKSHSEIHIEHLPFAKRFPLSTERDARSYDNNMSTNTNTHTSHLELTHDMTTTLDTESPQCSTQTDDYEQIDFMPYHRNPNDYDLDGRSDVYFIHEANARESIFTGSYAYNQNEISPAGYEYVYQNEYARKRAEMLSDSSKVEAPGLPPEYRKEFEALLQRYRGIFSEGQHDYGRTPLIKLKLVTKGEPRFQPYRPVPAHYADDVQVGIDSMLRNGIIKECSSPYNTNIVVVPKPGYTKGNPDRLRICVDFRQLNDSLDESTVVRNPIPLADMTYLKFGQGKYFCRFDLSQAYFSIEIADEESKLKTAFSVNEVQYCFNVAPFGIKTLPSIFNMLVHRAFAKQRKDLCWYFDDGYLIADNPRQMLERLELFFQLLAEANMRLELPKSQFFLTSLTGITWLGSIIKNNFIHPEPGKIEAIQKIPLPTSKKAVRSFLGTVNFVRKHLPGVAQLFIPLNQLIKKGDFEMTSSAKEAFEKLKAIVQSHEILALPDLTKRFFLTSDSSNLAIGCVLSQYHEEDTPKGKMSVEKPVWFASKTLTPAEAKGASAFKEFLAILYGCVTWHPLLIGKEFTIRTDSRSLLKAQYFKEGSHKLFARSLVLSEYQYTIEHMSKTQTNMMSVADGLSRMVEGNIEKRDKPISRKIIDHPIWEKLEPLPEMVDGTPMPKKEFEEKAVPHVQAFYDKHKAVFDACINEPKVKNTVRNVQSITWARARVNLALAQRCVCYAMTVRSDDLFHCICTDVFANATDEFLSLEGFSKAQKQDTEIVRKIRELERGDHNNDNYFLKSGILLKKVFSSNFPTGQKSVVVVPKVLVPGLLRHFHGRGRNPHIGAPRLILHLKGLFYWTNMDKDIQRHCSECVTCQLQQPVRNPRAPLQRLKIPDKPNALVAIDTVGPMPLAADGSRFILSIQDYFSKMVVFVPLKNKNQETVLRAFMQHWVQCFGKPGSITSDQGTETDSTLMNALCEQLNINKLRTSSFSPFGNPVERVHSTLQQALRSWLPDNHQKAWHLVVPLIANHLNATESTVTKVAPRKIFLDLDVEPVDLKKIQASRPLQDFSHYDHEYLDLLNVAKRAYRDIVFRNEMRYQDKMAAQNLGKQVKQYKVGQYIFIKNRAHYKLAPKFDDTIYRIIHVGHNGILCIDKDKFDPEVHTFRLRHHKGAEGIPDVKLVHPKHVRLCTGLNIPESVFGPDLENFLHDVKKPPQSSSDSEDSTSTKTQARSHSLVGMPRHSTNSSSSSNSDSTPKPPRDGPRLQQASNDSTRTLGGTSIQSTPSAEAYADTESTYPSSLQPELYWDDTYEQIFQELQLSHSPEWVKKRYFPSKKDNRRPQVRDQGIQLSDQKRSSSSPPRYQSDQVTLDRGTSPIKTPTSQKKAPTPLIKPKVEPKETSSSSPQSEERRELRGRHPVSVHDFVHMKQDVNDGGLPMSERDEIMYEELDRHVYDQYFDNLRRHVTLTRMFHEGEIQLPPPSVTSLMSVPITIRSQRSKAMAQTFRNHIRLQGKSTIMQDTRSLARFESQIGKEKD